jgi:hypothetical protein
MYEVDNSQFHKFRALVQQEANAVNNTDNTANNNVELNNLPQQLHINGMGAAGIGVTIVFLIPVLIGIMALMSIFVNTKTVEHPLLVGKIEY